MHSQYGKRAPRSATMKERGAECLTHALRLQTACLRPAVVGPRLFLRWRQYHDENPRGRHTGETHDDTIAVRTMSRECVYRDTFMPFENVEILNECILGKALE